MTGVSLSPAAILGIVMVMVGCTSNVVFLEHLVRYNNGVGGLVTFGQFLLISIEGFIFAVDFGRKKSAIPIKEYAIMVTLFFTVSIVNNFGFYFDIPMPLHMIFRAGSLIANMILGVIILKKQYPISKYLSVFMISVGIFICTLLSANQATSDVSEDSVSSPKYLSMLGGICMLTFALFVSARMGIYQEVLYSEYGKHPREALFYSHALPLGGFLLVGKDIYNNALLLSQSEPVTLFNGVDVPEMWLHFLGNIVTQYVCIRGVFILTTECPSLIVTLVVTLRKFVSLIFSILYFKNPFTPGHWLGTFLVFSGVLLFTETFQNIANALFPSRRATGEKLTDTLSNGEHSLVGSAPLPQEEATGKKLD